MANFSESRVQSMITSLRDEYGHEIATRELAILELEDMERKGCTHESVNKYDHCRDCPDFKKCPMLDWQKRHPEYADDELAMKIRILEAGGEEAYKARLKAREEAKRKAEEEKNLAKDEDRIDAACKVLQIIKDSTIEHTVSAHWINSVVDLIRNAKTTKQELEAAIAKFQ